MRVFLHTGDLHIHSSSLCWLPRRLPLLFVGSTGIIMIEVSNSGSGFFPWNYFFTFSLTPLMPMARVGLNRSTITVFLLTPFLSLIHFIQFGWRSHSLRFCL